MSGRVYLITGSSGIAAATARVVGAQPGACIHLVSLDQDSTLALAAELEAAGANVRHTTGDLTHSGMAEKAVAACVEHFGRVDALFNVAGGSGRTHGDGSIEVCTDEGWDWTLSTNATTQFRMCRAAVQRMLAQPRDPYRMRGTFLNMSSILALDPAPEYFDAIGYAASKGAVLSMSKTIAAAYASQGIACNVVAPALVSTRMSRRAAEDDNVQAFVRRKQPLAAGVIEAEQAGSVCAFFLSSGASRITGQTVRLDGGWSVS